MSKYYILVGNMDYDDRVEVQSIAIMIEDVFNYLQSKLDFKFELLCKGLENITVREILNNFIINEITEEEIDKLQKFGIYDGFGETFIEDLLNTLYEEEENEEENEEGDDE